MGPYAKLRQATDEKARFYTRLDPDARLIALESEAQLNKTEATETGATFTKGDALYRRRSSIAPLTNGCALSGHMTGNTHSGSSRCRRRCRNTRIV